jgi:hypothetical protein
MDDKRIVSLFLWNAFISVSDKKIPKMKLIHLLFAAIMIFNSCNTEKTRLISSIQKPQIAETNAINYDSCKKEILLLKEKKKTAWKNMAKPQKEKVFCKAVTETIIPPWIGTAWDFNGTSENPQQGSIACGYFVTTILRDAGLNLARFKLAQMASGQMISSLVQSKYIHRFSNISMADFIGSLQRQGYGLYIVGLDNHTGFIYNSGDDIYFIHSTYVGTSNVQKEKAVSSWILEQSKYRVLGKISGDEKVLERWIN